MNIEDILKAMTGEEGENLYNALVSQHRENKAKGVVDISTLGTKENPVSASMIPRLLGCPKKALVELEKPVDLTHNEKVQLGNIVDDYVFFKVMGVQPKVIKKFLRAYVPGLSQTKLDNAIGKAEKFLSYVESKALGAIMPEFMQRRFVSQLMKGAELGANPAKFLWFGGTPDIVFLHDNRYVVYDIKKSGRNTEEASINYFAQYYMYTELLDWFINYSGQQEFTPLPVVAGGIINLEAFAVKEGSTTKKDLIGVVESNIIDTHYIMDRVEQLKEWYLENNAPAILSDSCRYCGICFQNASTVHEKDLKQDNAIDKLVESLPDELPPVKSTTLVGSARKGKTEKTAKEIEKARAEGASVLVVKPSGSVPTPLPSVPVKPVVADELNKALDNIGHLLPQEVLDKIPNPIANRIEVNETGGSKVVKDEKDRVNAALEELENFDFSLTETKKKANPKKETKKKATKKKAKKTDVVALHDNAAQEGRKVSTGEKPLALPEIQF